MRARSHVWLPIAVTLVAAGALAACSRGKGPVEELASLLETLSNPTVSSSRLGVQLHAALDDASRAAIDRRARALGERLGVAVAPAEVLQVRGLRHGMRVSKVEATLRDTEAATLEVSFLPIAFLAPDGAEGAAPDSAEESARAGPDVQATELAAAPPKAKINVVREAGRWRIAFVDLVHLLESVPLDAQAAADGGR